MGVVGVVCGCVFFFFFFVFGFFFFFKQETAYELYQCDWSSDVCSSDLIGAPILAGGLTLTLLRSVDKLMILAYLPEREYAQIGRASCRERV